MGREGSHDPLLIDHRIQFTERKFPILDNLLFPSSRGDGIGLAIWPARLRVLDASVKKALGERTRFSRVPLISTASTI
jgi:isocitrate dehydrogenase